jgi:hypothetical protein
MKFLCSLAVVPFFAAASLVQAAPMAQLSDSQMDSVTAGFAFQSEDTSNTSFTEIRVWQAAQLPEGNFIVGCPRCYIAVNSPALSVGSAFGPSPI